MAGLDPRHNGRYADFREISSDRVTIQVPFASFQYFHLFGQLSMRVAFGVRHVADDHFNRGNVGILDLIHHHLGADLQGNQRDLVVGPFMKKKTYEPVCDRIQSIVDGGIGRREKGR